MIPKSCFQLCTGNVKLAKLCFKLRLIWLETLILRFEMTSPARQIHVGPCSTPVNFNIHHHRVCFLVPIRVRPNETHHLSLLEMNAR